MSRESDSPVTSGWTEIINVSRVSRPAPSVKVAATRLFDVDIVVQALFVNVVARVYFDMRIDNLNKYVSTLQWSTFRGTYGDHFASLGSHI